MHKRKVLWKVIFLLCILTVAKVMGFVIKCKKNSVYFKKIVICGLSTYFLKLNKNILSAYYFSVTLQP